MGSEAQQEGLGGSEGQLEGQEGQLEGSERFISCDFTVNFYFNEKKQKIPYFGGSLGF